MNFRQKKSLGQYFLHDQNILNKIVSLGDPKKDDIVWEIGPGAGSLTEAILKSGCELTVFEIDKELYPLLEKKFGDGIHLVREDILKVNWQSLLQGKKIKLIANIPYQITSPLLFKIVEHYRQFSRIVLMVQKELALRLQAVPRTKDYGALTLKINFYFTVKYEFTVKRHLFQPAPEVDSAVISMTPREMLPDMKNTSMFWKMIETAFGSRRKTLKNNLKRIVPLDKLEQLDFDLAKRAEELTEKDFLELYMELGIDQ